MPARAKGISARRSAAPACRFAAAASSSPPMADKLAASAATNSPDFHWVNDLELGVNDPRRIYAATRTGVWRSTDSGATWTRLLEINVRGGCLDLALRPDQPRTCSSHLADGTSRPRCIDSRAPPSDPMSEVVLRESDMGRTSLAIAPSNPDSFTRWPRATIDGPERHLPTRPARGVSLRSRRRRGLVADARH